jgi:hypothetical protein
MQKKFPETKITNTNVVIKEWNKTQHLLMFQI